MNDFGSKRPVRSVIQPLPLVQPLASHAAHTMLALTSHAARDNVEAAVQEVNAWKRRHKLVVVFAGYANKKRLHIKNWNKKALWIYQDTVRDPRFQILQIKDHQGKIKYKHSKFIYWVYDDTNTSHLSSDATYIRGIFKAKRGYVYMAANQTWTLPLIKKPAKDNILAVFAETYIDDSTVAGLFTDYRKWRSKMPNKYIKDRAFAMVNAGARAEPGKAIGDQIREAVSKACSDALKRTKPPNNRRYIGVYSQKNWNRKPSDRDKKTRVDYVVDGIKSTIRRHFLSAVNKIAGKYGVDPKILT